MNPLMQARDANRASLLQAHEASAAKRYDEAERLYREYIETFPQDPQVTFNLGVLLQQRARNNDERVEAATWYERCITSPYVANDTKASALNNLGILMLKVDRPDKASICFHLALTINPAHIEARVNYAESLRFECKYEEADKEFEEILKAHPDSAEAHFNRGMIKLILGDMKDGFEDYEWRFGVKTFGTPLFTAEKPLWRGEPLDGKTILLTMEQGFGDCIQFARYARLLKDMGATVWFYGHTALLDLMRGVAGIDRAFDQSDTEDFDFHVPIMSLPHRLGTTLETIPASIPYIRNAGWKPYDFHAHEPCAKKIGIVWAGSPTHGKDHWRSVAPNLFQPLIYQNIEMVFYSLQVGPRAGEVEQLKGIFDLAPSITNWTDTAQALQKLDLLISVDTATAHLAGALGVPVWLLVPSSPDFRWMLGREDSPWYPTMKLYRQENRGDWESVLYRIENDLWTV